MDLEELIQSIDAIEYIGQYVELHENGGEWWGISPFTYPPEKTPSFSVRKETGLFFDFSSGRGGGLLDFTKLYNKCSTREAIKILQDFAGYDGKIIRKRKLKAAEIGSWYLKRSRSVKPGISDSYKALPDDYMDRYEDRPEKYAIWEAEGISEASLRRFQVRYDAFSDRLVYPIRDYKGNIVNVAGRTLDPDYKEKKLRKYTYALSWKASGTSPPIYGLSENMEFIREKREIILFEGAKSVMKADTWGFKNAGALQTSHLSDKQMRVLTKLGFGVCFALDKGIDVKQDVNISRLKNFVNVWYIRDCDNFLDEKDAPVDKGLEVWQKLYERRVRYR